MQLLPRVRLLLARRPWIHWAVVAVCAAMVWWSLANAQHRADRARRDWGTATSVWVATADIEAGRAVAAERRDYPHAMVPVSAVSSLTADAIATRSIAAGEVIVAADVGAARTAPEGWVVFSVRSDLAPALAVADAASVFASGAWLCDGWVASVGTDTVDVAVPFECGGPLSTHLSADDLVLAAAT